MSETKTCRSISHVLTTTCSSIRTGHLPGRRRAIVDGFVDHLERARGPPVKNHWSNEMFNRSNLPYKEECGRVEGVRTYAIAGVFISALRVGTAARAARGRCALNDVYDNSCPWAMGR
ncbi:hypothetical protein EVAR_103092_1 [Eumeta japonica]|uniref:Uncharacterized protein n=1 Tax=Eumeta variegata TaxID=151549 RepID=A0A4C1WRC3_EUMVA|nr:hypothetical protein EVAR_103092_1 [Eumeta japonica]